MNFWWFCLASQPFSFRFVYLGLGKAAATEGIDLAINLSEAVCLLRFFPQIGNVGQTDATGKRVWCFSFPKWCFPFPRQTLPAECFGCFGCDWCSPFGSASAMVLRLITGKRTSGPSQAAKPAKPPVRKSQASVFRATEPVVFNNHSHFMLSMREIDIWQPLSYICRYVTSWSWYHLDLSEPRTSSLSQIFERMQNTRYCFRRHRKRPAMWTTTTLCSTGSLNGFLAGALIEMIEVLPNPWSTGSLQQIASPGTAPLVGLLPQFLGNFGGEFLEVFCPQKILREVDIEPGLEVEVLLLLGVDFLKIEMLCLKLMKLLPFPCICRLWSLQKFSMNPGCMQCLQSSSGSIFSTEHWTCVHFELLAEGHGIPEKVMLSYLQGEIEGEAAVKNLPATRLHIKDVCRVENCRALPHSCGCAKKTWGSNSADCLVSDDVPWLHLLALDTSFDHLLPIFLSHPGQELVPWASGDNPKHREGHWLWHCRDTLQQ